MMHGRDEKATHESQEHHVGSPAEEELLDVVCSSTVASSHLPGTASYF